MARFVVRFSGVEGEDTVDAVDRWDAVAQVWEQRGLGRTIAFWFNCASVRKLDRKKKKAWWEKEANSGGASRMRRGREGGGASP